VQARVDHVVIWVDDPLRSLDFYQNVVGLPGERVEQFREGKAPFPSVRVSAESILDLMARVGASGADALTGVDGSAGHPVNHVCLAMGRDEFGALRDRLAESGVHVSAMMENSFGARGTARKAFYFQDPDGNVIEARYYA
jgi:catechol 2,3-dioxygenase-like lactoylglutathione lyase family enzyme